MVGLTLHKFWKTWLVIGALILLMALTRLTALNQYLIVDEADRWHWAEDFVRALNRGDLAGTLIGDGYPGIVPVWGESSWILLEAGRRSLIEGQWIGEIGLNHLLHEIFLGDIFFKKFPGHLTSVQYHESIRYGIHIVYVMTYKYG